jgi:hypothetical protein
MLISNDQTQVIIAKKIKKNSHHTEKARITAGYRAKKKLKLLVANTGN